MVHVKKPGELVVESTAALPVNWKGSPYALMAIKRYSLSKIAKVTLTRESGLSIVLIQLFLAKEEINQSVKLFGGEGWFTGQVIINCQADLRRSDGTI